MFSLFFFECIHKYFDYFLFSSSDQSRYYTIWSILFCLLLWYFIILFKICFLFYIYFNLFSMFYSNDDTKIFSITSLSICSWYYLDHFWYRNIVFFNIYQVAIEDQISTPLQQTINDFVYNLCIFVDHIPRSASFYIFFIISKVFRNEIKRMFDKMCCRNRAPLMPEEENEQDNVEDVVSWDRLLNKKNIWCCAVKFFFWLSLI